MNNDVWIKCKRCGQGFLFSAGEQEFFRQKKITPPQSCRACREQRKLEEAERQARVEQAIAGAPKMTGVVEQFDNERGYGFIAVDGDLPVFFHCRSLRCRARDLRAGVKVEFYRIPSPRHPDKLCAVHVTLAEGNGAKPL